MNRAVVVALVASLAIGCQARARTAPALQPLGAEAEVHVYLQPLPADAARLALSIGSIAAVRADGLEAPLELVLADVSAKTAARQRLLAWGRLPPGSYSGFALLLRRATLTGAEGPADLLVQKDPVRLDVPFQVAPGRAAVVRLALRDGEAQESEFGAAAAFTGNALTPESTVTQVAGYCSRPALASVAVFDRHAHQVTAILPTGREPTGIAVDARLGRAYLALRGEDQVQVLDLTTGEDLGRVPLRGGDEPADLALTPDGRLVVVANSGSDTVAFVDAESAQLLSHVQVGLEPWRLRLDPDGRRAYVLDRRSGDLAVVDVAGRAVARTVATGPEPLAAQLNRAGTRLFLIHRGSAYLTILSVPDLAVVNQLFIGLGAGALEVDPRTDLVYVGRADEPRIQVFDALSLAPLDSIAVPAPVSYLTIDPSEGALVAVMPSIGAVGFVDLASRRVLSAVDVGPEPFRVTLVGVRR